MDLTQRGFLARAVPRGVVVVVAIAACVPLMLSLAGRQDVADASGGDFPSFYAAGSIVLDGRIDELYDAEVQRAYQADFHDHPDEFLYFAYPPFTAIAYAPLAALPYGAAFAVQSLAALAALIAALWMLWPTSRLGNPGIDGVLAATALGLVTYPIVVAVLGGQNTTFTLLLAAMVWRFAERRLFVATGLAAAAMLYKPQFGLIVIGFLVVARRWRAAAVAVAGGMVLYASAVIGLGPDWPSSWWNHITWFGASNTDVNGHLMVNISGWITAVFGDGPVPTGLVVVATLAVAGLTVLVLFRRGVQWLAFGTAMAAMLLIAPSALAYDAGIALVAGAVFIVISGASPVSIGVLVVASWSQLASRSLGWSPLFVVILLLWMDQIVALLRPPVSVSQAPGTIAAPADG